MRIVIASSVLWLSLAACDGDDMPVTPSSAIVSALPPMKTRIFRVACDVKNNTSPPYAMRMTALDLRDDTPFASALIEIDGTDFNAVTARDGIYWWRHDELPALSTIRIICPRKNPFDFRPVIAARVPYSINQCENLTVRIDLSRCESHPESVRRVRLRGMNASGFEESGFYPCDGMPNETAEYAGIDPSIWVETSELSAWDQAKGGLVGLVRRTRNVSVSYVDWSGTLHGPGIYGHMGVGMYEFRPNEVHDISIIKPDDCEAPGYAERMAPKR